MLQGNASQAASLLEAGLASLVATGVHSCHQLCADMYILLGSAWRMLARAAQSCAQKQVAWGRVAMHSLLLGEAFQQAVQAGGQCRLLQSHSLVKVTKSSQCPTWGRVCCQSTFINSS